ncbi:hypothetical protein, partial [Bacteroides fragilis]|uniref:hypothetical protein n=1 Tax=Bacteroides fragilis TaxID=817 RepID=UPI00374E2DD8
SQSFVLSAPEINIFPTALTMLTRSSVQFLFDSCLIPAKVPPSFLLKPRLISVKFPLKSLFSFQFPPANTSPSPFLGKSPFPSPR